MGRLAKLHQRRDWRNRSWESLVNYANSTSDVGSVHSQEKTFRKMLLECMNWLGGEDEDIEECNDMKNASSVSDLAAHHRPNIRQVLVWLSAPQQWRDVARRAAKFLEQYGTGIRMSIHANSEFTKENDDPLMFKWPEAGISVIGPVCKFILDQIALHDMSDATLSEAVPIGLCERSGCGRLFMVTRARRRRFCGDRCRSGAYQSGLPRAQRRETVRKYRANLRQMQRSKPIRFPKRKQDKHATYSRPR